MFYLKTKENRAILVALLLVYLALAAYVITEFTAVKKVADAKGEWENGYFWKMQVLHKSVDTPPIFNCQAPDGTRFTTNISSFGTAKNCSISAGGSARISSEYRPYLSPDLVAYFLIAPILAVFIYKGARKCLRWVRAGEDAA